MTEFGVLIMLKDDSWESTRIEEDNVHRAMLKVLGMLKEQNSIREIHICEFDKED